MVHIKRLQEDNADIISIIGEIDASSSIELDLTIAKSLGEGFKKLLWIAVRWNISPRPVWGFLCPTSKR
jgi:hypothetical protein